MIKILIKTFIPVSFVVFGLSVQAAEIFGGYSSGCIKDAVPFPLQSAYHQSLQSHPGRNYAHPDMVEFLNDLMKSAKKAKIPPLLIGDISLKNGGPLPKSSHASHNIGLDVDIPFDFAFPQKTLAQLQKPKDLYLVQSNTLSSHFNNERATLIKLAALHPKVTRIFVSPLIKEGLCHFYKNDKDKSWLGKVRPWFGHRAHMHVRLACPIDSPNCVTQDPPPSGDGCGQELISWFMPADTNKRPLQQTPKKRMPLPYQCKTILSND